MNKTYSLDLVKPNGDDFSFTTYASSEAEAKEIAKKEYPKYTFKNIELVPEYDPLDYVS